MVRQTILTYAIVASSQMATAVSVDNRTLDEIYRAAQQETGVLNVYFGGSCKLRKKAFYPEYVLTAGKAQAAATPLLTAFNESFPKVKINITVELSKYADSKIDRSYIEDEAFIDYAMLQTVQDFPRWKAEGKLLEYKPPHFEDVNHAIKDEDGAYVPVGYCRLNSHFTKDTSLILFRSVRPILLRLRKTVPRKSSKILRRCSRSFLEEQNCIDIPKRRRWRLVPICPDHSAAWLQLAGRASSPKHQMGPRRGSSDRCYYQGPRVCEWFAHSVLLWSRWLYPVHDVSQGSAAHASRSFHDLGSARRHFQVYTNARKCETTLGVPSERCLAKAYRGAWCAHSAI